MKCGMVFEGGSVLPDGKYFGTWSGYEVTVTNGGRTFRGRSIDGVRGMNIPCIVQSHGGRLVVQTASGSREDR